MAAQDQHQQPTIEDCSDSEDELYYTDNNNEPSVNNQNSNNNNNAECEDRNQPSAPYRKLLNIQVTAKVLFGSVGAISALNAERKKPKPSSSS